MANLTIAQFLEECKLSANSAMDDITEEQFTEYLNQALLARHDEMITYVPKEYDKEATITFVADGRTVPYPDNMSTDTSYNLYTDESMDPTTGVPSDQYEVRGGNFRFYNQKLTGQIYYAKYSKIPSQYDYGESGADEIVETSVTRTRNILKYEIKSMWFSAEEDGEATPADQNQVSKANRIS